MKNLSPKFLLLGALVLIGILVLFIVLKSSDTPESNEVTQGGSGDKVPAAQGAPDDTVSTTQDPPGDNTSSGATVAKPLNLDTGDDKIDWASLPSSSITLSNKPLLITEPGTYTLTGKSNQGIVVDSEGDVQLQLNGVTISNKDGAAIYIKNSNNTVVQLASDSENLVEDAPDRGAKELDGVIYSSDDLIFTGTGTLIVKASIADGIVSKDDLRIKSGTYIITGPDDGIRGKDSVAISGGSITIDVDDDGIKSNNDSDAEKGFVYVAGGKITINSGDDAIKADSQIVIDGGEIDIQSSVEGLEATNITINGGRITLIAADDGINAASSNQALRGAPFIIVNGGYINVTVASGDTDAFDSNGDLFINGGEIHVTAPRSSFDADGKAEFTNGEVTINGEKVDELPKSHGGGPRRSRSHR